ncbi:phasin family protein [Methylobacterium sp. J-030]|uniref:TIGR01841 family phasin n=1 Tax=Methylobacterium sp. J-030 TaxID=2836627 RepID=UPI001FB97F46|nr:TIGR01841 family phasin [Methylobacterium sp. J-030]MCJ2073901.1 phasin family protein [Methylobacterium sp. J-030]
MQTRDAHPFPRNPIGFGAPWRRLGITGRAAQTLGIEWSDSIKRGLDDLAATAGTLAAARNPAEILAVQAAYLQRAGARLSARSAVTTDLITALAADLLRLPAPGPPRTH